MELSGDLTPPSALSPGMNPGAHRIRDGVVSGTTLDNYGQEKIRAVRKKRVS
jgi:hypothetical protein